MCPPQIEHLKACDEVACSRTSNWQTFCLEEKSNIVSLLSCSHILLSYPLSLPCYFTQVKEQSLCLLIPPLPPSLISSLPPYIHPSYISSHVGTLPYLFQTLFLLDEGLAPLILQLVQVALSGVPSKPPEKDQPKKESSGKKSKHFESRREAKEAKESKEQSKEAKESKPTTPTPC